VIVSRQVVKCPNCGIEGYVGESCIKCNTRLYRTFTRPLYVIDVAHSGEDVDDAIRKVTAGIETSLRDNHRGLKVIHGRGSRAGHSAVIRNHIVQFLKREARRLKARLVMDKDNPGAHILFFN